MNNIINIFTLPSLCSTGGVPRPAGHKLLIVSLALVAALLQAGCAGEARGTRLENVNGYACDADGVRRFDVLHIDAAGRVVCSDADCPPGARARHVIDGRGRTLWPGLIDAHAHLLNLGTSRQRLELNGTGSLDEILERLAQWAANNPGDGWIIGRGWNQMHWPVKEFPGAADLDRVVANRPVMLERIDGHAVWVNSKALEIAGIDSGSEAPPGGEIIRDAAGRPTGILVDNAESLVRVHLPAPDEEEIARAYLLAMREANRLGLTGVHEAGSSAREVQVLRRLADADQLTLRLYVMLSDTDENLAALERPLTGLANGRLSVRSVKIYADGALGSRGAALLAPYSDREETTGLLFLDEAAITARIRKANARGFQAAVHAIGDRANRVTLNAFDSLQNGRPSPLRNRIEHAQVVAPDDIPRFAQLGVIASMQPVHASSDMWMAEQRLDPGRLEGAYAWRSLIDSGARLAFGSDFPVEEVNPFFGIHAAVNRADHEGQPQGGWRPEQRVSLATALCAFTRDAAYAAHEEDQVGSLDAGQWADFILLEQDPFGVKPGDLWQVKVLETWLGGKRVYPVSRQP